MIGLGFRQEQGFRQELRLELKQALQEPGPASAARGFAGMRIAHDILTDSGLPGLLIGGLARKAWISPNRSALSSRKDVDVVVLRRDPDRFPSRFEGGIDWWLPDENGFLTNGNGVELIFVVGERLRLKPGLYLPQPEALWSWRQAEHLAFGKERTIRDAYPRLRVRPLILEYPLCPSVCMSAGFTPRERWKLL